MGLQQYIVDAAAAGQRVDLFVAGGGAQSNVSNAMSRAGAQKLIEAGHVKVNGALAKPSLRLKAGDCVTLQLPEVRDVGLVGEDLPLTIIHEDDDVLVINKAAGMVVHPAAGRTSGTLVNAVLHHCPAIAGIGGDRRPGIVHRLDKDTSGVMVVAKNDLAMRSLMGQFKNRTVHKEYLALVQGDVGAERGEVDRAIGRHRTDRKRMSSLRVTGKSRPATTAWLVEERYAIAISARQVLRYCLLRLIPRTGRTHQIRVHLADMGYPLIGDHVYGGRNPLASRSDGLTRQDESFPRHALHAERLSFQHVRTGARLCFAAPMADDMASLIADLRSQSLGPNHWLSTGLTRIGV